MTKTVSHVQNFKIRTHKRQTICTKRSQSSPDARGMSVSVRERRDTVGQQETFVVDRRQTSFAQFACRDLVPHRPESAKLALGRTPAVEDV